MTTSSRLLSTITRIRARSPFHFITSAAAALGPTVALYALRPCAPARASSSKLSFSSSVTPLLYHHHLLFADQFIPPHIDYEAAFDMGKAGKASKAGKAGYYAVQKGRSPGIYDSWSECEANIKGFAGAVYKKFDTEAEAKTFLQDDGYGTKSNAGSASSSGSSSGCASGSAMDVPQTSLNRPQPSYHPYIATIPPLINSSAKKKKQVSAPAHASALGKRRAHDHHDEPAPSKRSHVNPVFPPPAAAASGSGSGSKRKGIVYCDGSSIGNGKKGARAGWGVFFEDPDLHHLNESRRLTGPIQTNNRAELTAIIRAIQLCPNDGRQLLICSDSKYSMDAVNSWLPGWKKKGYKTSSGGEVQNLDLILQLADELKGRYPHPKLEYVKAHSGIDGNEIVDRMAKFGASLPVEDSKELDKRSNATEGNVKHVELGEGFTISVSVTPAKEKGQIGHR